MQIENAAQTKQVFITYFQCNKSQCFCDNQHFLEAMREGVDVCEWSNRSEYVSLQRP